MQNQQAQLLAACPEEQPAGRMAMSSDGAMVPLVGGVWAEVKLVAIGAVERRRHNFIGAQGIHFYALREFTDRLVHALSGECDLCVVWA